ITSSS
ncbi:hypothetical protein D046_7309B, partial [Vibrio parahaemolyticus V-223/04]